MNRPLRELAEIHYGKSPSEVIAEDGLVPIVGTGGIYGSAKKAMFSGPAVVVPRKGTLGNPQLMESSFWPVDTTYAVVPNSGVDARWLYYNLCRYDLTKLNEATGVPSISRDWLFKIRFDDPGEVKQKRIASILKTIDSTIQKTEVLIAKYHQIKAGMMHDLFTRGVDAHGRLRPPREQAPELYKESPVGWIPKEWDCVQISDLCSHVVDCPHSTPFYQDSGVACIRTADMEPGQLLLEQAYKVSQADYLTRVQRLTPRKGDIIYSREGERLGIASPVGEDKICLGQRVMLLRPDQKVDQNFLLWSMNLPGFYRRVVRGLGATTSPHVNVGDVKNVLTYRPPEIEQIFIGKYIRTVHSRLICEERCRKKLLSQKDGLMHDLLTGRVRVKVTEPDKQEAAA
jgi:type I restriction enzyme S subunit